MSSKTLHFPSPRHLSAIYGDRAENLAHVERLLGIKLVSREDWLKLEGPADKVATAETLFAFLDQARSQGMAIRTPDFHRISDAFARGEGPQLRTLMENPLVIATNRKTIVPKTLSQKLYLQSMIEHDVVFGIGPAGTG
ncbi:MAG: PhoH family protein, partial [Verrucomicrobiota bacterium]